MVKLRHALCWAVIYVARAMVWARLHYNDLFIGDASPLRRWTTRPLGGSTAVVLITPLGRVLMAPCAWMAAACVAMVRLANRGLPPLPPGEGFLIRLYPR